MQYISLYDETVTEH